MYVVFLNNSREPYTDCSTALTHATWLVRRFCPKVRILYISYKEKKDVGVLFDDWYDLQAARGGVMPHLFESILSKYTWSRHSFHKSNLLRWVWIQYAMNALHLKDSAVMLDADVGVFDDLDRVAELALDGADYTLHSGMSAGISFMQSPTELLESWVHHACEVFTDRAKFPIDEKSCCYIGWGDMEVWRDFRKSHPHFTCKESSELFPKYAIDHNHIEDDGVFIFDQQARTKRIAWRNGRPYGILSSDGTQHPFCMIHFCGTKHLMGTFVAHIKSGYNG